jgi:hypothetical protein
MSNAMLVVQEGGYHCPECLKPIHFEVAQFAPSGDQIDARGFAVGKCLTASCDRYGVRLKVQLRTIEVEELPTHEENPRGTQTDNRINGGSGN